MFIAPYTIDSTLFRWINTGTANPVFDGVMPFVTEPRNPFLVVPLIALAVYALWRWRSRTVWCIAVLALTITVSDQFNSRYVKNWVGRLRPCHVLSGVRELKPCGGGKSFPSSHAVNMFAAALVIGYFFRKALPYWLALATVIAYSRVYVGVHYPGDVLGGALLGSAIAGCMIWLWHVLARRWQRPPTPAG